MLYSLRNLLLLCVQAPLLVELYYLFSGMMMYCIYYLDLVDISYHIDNWLTSQTERSVLESDNMSRMLHSI